MKPAVLEHVNVTVPNAEASAQLLCDLFGWRIRWQGQSQSGGRSVHVGADESYIAFYTPPEAPAPPATTPGAAMGGLNHVALLVEDLDEAERRVKTAGLHPFNHGAYHPGRRFYFHDADQVEYEVVSYD